MDAILTHTAELPAIPAAPQSLRRRLSALALLVLERLTSPPRDVPPEFFRFSPF